MSSKNISRKFPITKYMVTTEIVMDNITDTVCIVMKRKVYKIKSCLCDAPMSKSCFADKENCLIQIQYEIVCIPIENSRTRRQISTEKR